MNIDLTVDDLCLSLGERLLIDHVTHRFPSGSVTLIIGSNGSGKSMFIETLAGLHKPTSGSIHIGDSPLWIGQRVAVNSLLSIGFASQQPEHQLFGRTIDEEFRYTVKPYRQILDVQQQSAARQFIMDKLGGNAPMQRDPFLLSGGEKRDLSMALLEATSPQWLLLDEPTAGLDRQSIRQLNERLCTRKSRGLGSLIITHDLEELLPSADYVMMIHQGKMVWSGLPSALAENPTTFEAAGMVIPEQLAVLQMMRNHGYLLPDGWLSADTAAGILTHHPPVAATHSFSAALGTVNQSVSPVRSVARPASPVDRFDPRMLWLAYMMLTPGILLQSSWIGWLAGAALALLTIRFTNIPYQVWSKPAIGLTVFTLMVTITSGIQISPSLTMNWNAAVDTFYQFSRLVMIMLIGFALFTSIPPLRLKRALEQGLSGLRLLRLPYEQFALTAAIMVRFIPILFREWQRFSLISAARGKYPNRPGKVPLKHMRAIIIPFLMALLRIGDTLSTLLIARGVGRMNRKPSMAYKLNFGKHDLWLFLISAVVLTGFIFIQWLSA
jgi:energy-coupling factor transport system permease/ATP-binding protein